MNPQPAAWPRRSFWGTQFLVGAVCFGFLLQAVQVPNLPAHVDELRMLADVYLAHERQLDSPLLTFVAHLYQWVLTFGASELDQLTLARWVQWVMQVLTGGLVFLIARTRFSPSASLLAVLAGVTFSFVLHHGASLRFDTLVAFLTLAAVALLLRSKQGGAGTPLALLLLALALLITIKTVLLLPMFAAIIGLRWLHAPDRRSETVALALGSAAAAMFLWVALQWHMGFVAGNAMDAASREAGDGWWTTVMDAGFLPRGRDALRALIDNPVQVVLMAGGWWLLARSPAAQRAEQGITLPWWPLALPLLSLLFYRNAYTYFYVILVPLACVGVAAWAERMRPRTRGVLAVVMLLLAGLHTYIFMKDVPIRARQETLHAIVHSLFPQPVPYIDCCSMLPSFHKHGFFMSHKGGADYRRHGQPVMRAILEKHAPVFVLANHPWLIDAFTPMPANASLLLQEDLDTLHSNYLPAAGQIHVAGKRLPVSLQDSQVDMLIPGPYQLQSMAPVVINGVEHPPQAVVELPKGILTLRSEVNQMIVLRWHTGAKPSPAGWPQGSLIPSL
jgi:Dolichyl-phosphate-mannose-protein mannosyltransferase